VLTIEVAKNNLDALALIISYRAFFFTYFCFIKIKIMKDQKTTAVFGSSVKPMRFSFKAINKLRQNGHPVHALGLREGRVADVDIKTGKPELNDVHTVTMYLGPQNQPEYYDYIKSLKPKRVIFNPGTENSEFANMLKDDGIEVVEYCTLIMLDMDMF
jgi:predicted CoA-binding protein